MLTPSDKFGASQLDEKDEDAAANAATMMEPPQPRPCLKKPAKRVNFGEEIQTTTLNYSPGIYPIATDDTDELNNRVKELEDALKEKDNLLGVKEETIERLEAKLRKMEEKSSGDVSVLLKPKKTDSASSVGGGEDATGDDHAPSDSVFASRPTSSALNRTLELNQMTANCAEFATLCETFAAEKDQLEKRCESFKAQIRELEKENEEIHDKLSRTHTNFGEEESLKVGC